MIFLSMLSGIPHASGIERRRDQFQGQPGYYIVPVPYRLTGIGEGLILLGAALNVADTNMDVYGFGFTGDLEGYGAGALDIHLLPRTLIFDVTTERISKATLTSYSKRGMDTEEDDYTLVDLGDIEFNLARLTATFPERRLEFYGMGYEAASKLEGIRERDGTLILDVQNPERDTLQHLVVGARLDITDDYLDPRKGVRLDISRGWSPQKISGSSDYYVMEYNATGYVPVGKRSTIALNYFRSDAFVVSTGETDRATIESDRGLDCGSIADPEEQQQCNQVVDNIIAENRYGTASSLGGPSRLRSYSHDRLYRRSLAFLRGRVQVEHHGRVHAVQYSYNEGYSDGYSDGLFLRDRQRGGPS